MRHPANLGVTGQLQYRHRIHERDHEASIGLHRSLGFETVGIEREVGRKFGRWLDVVLMQTLLGPTAPEVTS